jgi:hypothetical protein
VSKALSAYKEALEQNPQSTEVATKVKRLTQLIRDNKRSQDKEQAKGSSKTDKNLNFEQLSSELVSLIPAILSLETKRIQNDD